MNHDDTYITIKKPSFETKIYLLYPHSTSKARHTPSHPHLRHPSSSPRVRNIKKKNKQFTGITLSKIARQRRIYTYTHRTRPNRPFFSRRYASHEYSVNSLAAESSDRWRARPRHSFSMMYRWGEREKLCDRVRLPEGLRAAVWFAGGWFCGRWRVCCGGGLSGVVPFCGEGSWRRSKWLAMMLGCLVCDVRVVGEWD